MKNNLILIGERLKSLREGSGLTQMMIAKYLSVDQSFISKVEIGERALTSDMLENIAHLFGVGLYAFESSQVDHRKITLALRAKEISEEDLHVISAINKIALNCDFMTDLLGSKNAN